MQMIKRLRRKLITVSMLSLILVLGIIVSAANWFNYRKIVTDADHILEVLAENDGSFPELKEDTWHQPGEEGFQPGEGNALGDRDPSDGGTLPDDSSPSTGETPPEGGPPPAAASPATETTAFSAESQPDTRNFGGRGRWRDLSEETPFESRFFSVLLQDDGTVDDVEMTRIAAVSRETAIEYAQAVAGGGKTRGFYQSYRYLICDSTTSSRRIIFLDRQNQLATFRTFLLVSYGLSAAGLLTVLALITLLSGRIIRPFVDNYEKQRRFITDAGHELKTPLAIIEADSDVLEMDLGENNEWLTDIRKQTHRLSELTANLIFLARSEEGGQHFQKIDFPFSDVVEEAAESYRGPAIAQNKTFSLKVQPMLSLCGDEKSIRQLVGILMDNALKYTPEGGDISLTLKREGRWLRLSVYNTAENVSREQLPHLFDRFYRTDASRNSATGGYGIGLSIAQAIVTGHKGQIRAATEDEKSLTITASFPAE